MPINEAKVGDMISFGHYVQGSDATNGADPIIWRVLRKSGSELTIISEKGLDCKKYNETYASVTWETCTLRSWLNSDFYSSSFSSDEKAKIKTTHRDNPNNPSYGTEGGNATDDNVWLLSYDEAKTWLSSAASRKCTPTAYAKSSCINAYNDCCNWWLSTPGYRFTNNACFVYGGNVHDYGDSVSKDGYCVRPALTIKI